MVGVSIETFDAQPAVSIESSIMLLPSFLLAIKWSKSTLINEERCYV